MWDVWGPNCCVYIGGFWSMIMAGSWGKWSSSSDWLYNRQKQGEKKKKWNQKWKKKVYKCDNAGCKCCISPVQPEQGSLEHDQAPPGHQNLSARCIAGTSGPPRLLHCHHQSWAPYYITSHPVVQSAGAWAERRKREERECSFCSGAVWRTYPLSVCYIQKGIRKHICTLVHVKNNSKFH